MCSKVMGAHEQGASVGNDGFRRFCIFAIVNHPITQVTVKKFVGHGLQTQTLFKSEAFQVDNVDQLSTGATRAFFPIHAVL